MNIYKEDFNSEKPEGFRKKILQLFSYFDITSSILRIPGKFQHSKKKHKA